MVGGWGGGVVMVGVVVVVEGVVVVKLRVCSLTPKV